MSKDQIGQIVDAIVLTRFGKPKLRPAGRFWTCWTRGGTGHAHTPRGAYFDYLEAAGTPVREELDGTAQVHRFCDLHPEWRITRVYNDA
jgi:hypothetical protein